jgi:hypothetical protein
LNPLGPELYHETFRLVHHPVLITLPRWQPLDFSSPWHWLYLTSLLLLAATVLLGPRSFTPTQVLVLLTLGVAPCLQQRTMVWWAMLVPWLALPQWAALGKALPWSWLHTESRPRFRFTLIASLAVLVACLGSAPVLWAIRGGPPPLDITLPPSTPWRLALQLQGPSDGTRAAWLPTFSQELRRSFPDGRFTGTIFASPVPGDYLLWALAPGIPVTLYSQLQLFSDEHWNDCTTIATGATGWWEILDRWQVNLVVIEADSAPRLGDFLRHDAAWQIASEEPGGEARPGKQGRYFIALRKVPIDRMPR